MALLSGYMECVKLHHIWKPQPHAVVCHLTLKPKRGAFFSPELPIHFQVGNGTNDLGGYQAT